VTIKLITERHCGRGCGPGDLPDGHTQKNLSRL